MAKAGQRRPMKPKSIDDYRRPEDRPGYVEAFQRAFAEAKAEAAAAPLVEPEPTHLLVRTSSPETADRIGSRELELIAAGEAERAAEIRRVRRRRPGGGRE